MSLNYTDGPGTTGAIVVGTTAVEAKIGGSRFDDRKILIIQPMDNPIYWSYDSGVTTSTGHYLPEGALVYISTGELLPVYLIAGSNTDVRLSEVG
jgi:hypothetical protein